MEQSDTILENLTFSSDSIEAAVPLDTGAVVKYRIVDIRRERTGLHGAAAMLMARHEELIGQPERIKEILCETATDLGRERDFQGHGLVDVLCAIQSV